MADKLGFPWTHLAALYASIGKYPWRSELIETIRNFAALEQEFRNKNPRTDADCALLQTELHEKILNRLPHHEYLLKICMHVRIAKLFSDSDPNEALQYYLEALGAYQKAPEKPVKLLARIINDMDLMVETNREAKPSYTIEPIRFLEITQSLLPGMAVPRGTMLSWAIMIRAAQLEIERIWNPARAT